MFLINFVTILGACFLTSIPIIIFYFCRHIYRCYVAILLWCNKKDLLNFCLIIIYTECSFYLKQLYYVSPEGSSEVC